MLSQHRCIVSPRHRAVSILRALCNEHIRTHHPTTRLFGRRYIFVQYSTTSGTIALPVFLPRHHTSWRKLSVAACALTCALTTVTIFLFTAFATELLRTWKITVAIPCRPSHNIRHTSPPGSSMEPTAAKRSSASLLSRAGGAAYLPSTLLLRKLAGSDQYASCCISFRLIGPKSNRCFSWRSITVGWSSASDDCG